METFHLPKLYPLFLAIAPQTMEQAMITEQMLNNPQVEFMYGKSLFPAIGYNKSERAYMVLLAPERG